MAGMRSKVYFMRHGETYWNVMGKMQGQVNIPLTACLKAFRLISASQAL